MWLLLTLASLALAQQCYFPDGSPSPDKPCPKTLGQQDTACCGTQNDGSSAICLSNNLCLSDLKISRGSCTDSTWNAFACPHYCLTVSPLNGGWPLTPCSSGSKTLWSCNTCASSNFTLNTGTFRFTNDQLEGFNNASGITNSTCPAPSNTTCVQSPCDQTRATVAEGVIGGTLGAAFLTVLGLFFYEKRRNKRLLSSINAATVEAPAPEPRSLTQDSLQQRDQAKKIHTRDAMQMQQLNHRGPSAPGMIMVNELEATNMR